MSESTFDPVKRRFGGKSKPVMLPNGSAGSAAAAAAAAGEGGTPAGTSSGSSSSNKGVRLSFSQGTKIATTKEAMHASLHCRCVFVLLCELSSSDSNSASATSRTGSSRRVDTAHLVALSPDDLFCALSIDSFPLSVSPAARGTTPDSSGGSNSGSGRLRQQQLPQAAGTLPRAFEVVDGPMVIHRPAAKQGEPWRGLETFRPEGASGTWRGYPVPLAAVGSRHGNQDGGDVDGGDRLADILGGGDGGNRGAACLRLDLSAAAAAAAAAADGHGGFLDLTPSPSGGSAAGWRSKKRASAAGSNALLVCPPGASLSIAGRGSATQYFGVGGRDGLGGTAQGSTGVDAAVVVLPATAAAPASAAAGAKPETTPPSPPQWMSLTTDHEGVMSLEPWRGVPSESRTPPTCVCRAPDLDSGVVDLASGAAAGRGGLLLRPLPPTMYVGVALGGGRSGTETTAGAAVGARARGGGGALLELQRGALSCHRLLPAPPSAVVTAAVDDAQGVVAVLLDDQDGTALLLARDGSDLPVVEEHRGITAVFKGDFLGNGREQVALLSPPLAGGGSGGGGGKTGKRGAAAAVKAGAGGWEQLPLKALVKRALVTDCSRVWGNERRDIALSPPGGNGGGANGAVGPTVEVSRPSKESPKGRKRQRPGTDEDAAAAGTEKVGSGASGAAAVGPNEPKQIEGPEGDHRLSSLSNVVGVLRRRVRAEEARLLELRQARRGKAAALEAAKLALAACVGGSGAGHNSTRGDSDDDQSDGPSNSIPRTFIGGLVAPGSSVSETAPSSPWACGRASEAAPPTPAPPQCAVARVRFHAPSRALCLDAHVSNPSPGRQGEAREPSATVFDVCLAVASAAGRLTTRSAVCPRLRPGETATVRACVDVPFDLLVGGAGPGGAASLFASCTWSLDGDNAAEKPDAGRPPAAVVDLSPGAGGSRGTLRPSSSLVFSRIFVTSQDMLGIGSGLSSSAAQAIGTATGTGPYHPPAITAKNNGAGGSTSSNGGGSGAGARSRRSSTSTSRRQKYLGLFDVGTRVDLLLWSDPATTSTTLATLPQAVRSLSDVAALPEPWAGGAAVQVNECSERAAECTLRAADSASAPTVLMTVVAGALPDGARASADHASDQGRALIAAAAAALGDEIAALEAVARERGRLSGGAGKKNGDGGGGGVEAAAVERLSQALERYGAAQMRSDVLASRLAGRVVAARGGAV